MNPQQIHVSFNTSVATAVKDRREDDLVRGHKHEIVVGWLAGIPQQNQCTVITTFYAEKEVSVGRAAF